MLDDYQIEQLNQLERIALKWEYWARHLRGLVVKCREQQTTEGIAEMVAFTFNAQQYQPRYGGGGEQLPPGEKYKGVIVNIEPINTTDQSGNVKGGYLALTLTPIEGPLAGQKHIDRLNLHHTNPKTVEIANEQMSAYCHVLGVYNVQDTAQLLNIPFLFDIGWQKGQEPSQERPNGGYTEVKALYDINGNAPGKAGAGAQPQPQQQPQAAPPPAQQPPAQVAPAAAPPAQWGQGQPQPGQPQAAPQAAPPAQAGWGGAPAPAAAPQPQGQPQGWGGGQPPAQQPQAAPGAAPWGGPPQQ
jgi:hypothetical protein